MKHLDLVAVVAFTASTAIPVAAQETASQPIVTGGDTTIVYVFPTSPQAFVPVIGLPSFLVMPGADAPKVATQVIYTTPGPVASTDLVGSVDLDCSNFNGSVTISGPDAFDLDKDGDGIGCEQEDR
ncbi:hypothetical protein [Devosia nitrariae]|uniref:Excalibur calcium-binding domain-containing protein n=1 Tax=Devosia nitrariae TaxID=2071872 RepID=A0ABQ5W032_9HYPH|nr:hypothetical protein [Devosia nitrariae]GLQ53116.1 hypothetical protein GCM10010862_03740 [Devosia nitrariae]